MVFTSPAQTGVSRRQGDGVLGCACFRGAPASKSQQSGREVRRQGKQGGDAYGDELSLDG